MHHVYEFSPSFEPSYKGEFDQFKQDFPNVEVGSEIAPGVYHLYVYFDEPLGSDYRILFLTTSPEAMEQYAEEVNAELYDQLNSLDLEAPDDEDFEPYGDCENEDEHHEGVEDDQ